MKANPQTRRLTVLPRTSPHGRALREAPAACALPGKPDRPATRRSQTGGSPKRPPQGTHPPTGSGPETPSRPNPSASTRPRYRESLMPGPHLQPLSVPGRVTSSSNTESITDTERVVALMSVAAAPLVSPAVTTRPALQVPAPSDPALVWTPAAPLEFKPQPPPFFPALLPTETRRDQRGAGREAGQGSAGGRHLN